MEKLRTDLLVKALREEQGMTQAVLAEKAGVGQELISRYENGKKNISREVFDRLLVALGENPDDYTSIRATAEDKRIVDIKNEIKALLRCSTPEVDSEVLRRIEHLEANDNAFKLPRASIDTQRFLLKTRIDLSLSLEETLELCERAIKLTRPKFELHHLQDCLFTFDEALILNRWIVAIRHKKTLPGEDPHKYLKESRSHLDNLYKAFDKDFTWGREEARLKSVIVFNIANTLWDLESFSELLEPSLLGIKICEAHELSLHYPLFLFYQGVALFKNQQTEEAITLLRRACSILDGYNRTTELNLQKTWIKDNLGLDSLAPTCSYTGN